MAMMTRAPFDIMALMRHFYGGRGQVDSPMMQQVSQAYNDLHQAPPPTSRHAPWSMMNPSAQIGLLQQRLAQMRMRQGGEQEYTMPSPLLARETKPVIGRGI